MKKLEELVKKCFSFASPPIWLLTRFLFISGAADARRLEKNAAGRFARYQKHKTKTYPRRLTKKVVLYSIGVNIFFCEWRWVCRKILFFSLSFFHDSKSTQKYQLRVALGRSGQRALVARRSKVLRVLAVVFVFGSLVHVQHLLQVYNTSHLSSCI